MDYQTQMVMERVGDGILQVAESEERKLDAQIQALENLGNRTHSMIIAKQ